ncbi:hypothetical protein [Halosimplex pelagicum]|uniref:Uncharacterized protein n=1 Tax=Halosimplex pelagicum TaxID=869886 RepID=A0A7D5P6X3_9EURY|nr:hypothetical protein [Halosimplex pelagicum]QLH80681.1 hypothetical protein HZS54_03100 [Halosimplex pelagicum]
MAGSQRTELGVESAAKVAGIAAIAVVFGNIAVNVFESMAAGQFASPVSLTGIQYAAINELTTVAVIGSVLVVFVRGVDAELVAQASGVVYAVGLVQTLLFEVLGASFDPRVGLLLAPLSVVLYFLGFVLAFYLYFETDIVDGRSRDTTA